MAQKLLNRKSNPAKYYIPNGKIEQFIKLVGEGETFICMISAANGVGKTAVGANIVANICYGVQSKWFDYPIFKNFPYPKTGRIVSNTKTIEETICGGQKELEAWLPKGRYEGRKGGKQYNSHFKTDTGFEFDAMTYEQDPQEFESKTLGWCWFDEPPPKAIFKATIARMRRGGIIFITQTPLENAAWMYDEIITKQQVGQRAVIMADIEDNCKEHGIRGILSHSHIETMIAEYSEEEREARIHGRFQHLVGRVFKKFDRRIHVVRPFAITEKDFTVYHAYDVHAQLPDALLWVAVRRDGRLFIVDEMFEHGQTSEIAARVRQKEASGYRVVSRVMDQAGFLSNKQERLERSLAQVYDEEHNLTYLPASKQRTVGIKMIQDAIDYEEKAGVLVREPLLYVFDTCPMSIHEFEHITWQTRTGRGADQHDPVQKTVDKDDHQVPENLYRILIQNPEFSEREEQISNNIDYGQDGY